MSYLYVVATNKDVLVTVRIAESVRDDFKRAAELRGATMSGLMHQYIVRTIREELGQVSVRPIADNVAAVVSSGNAERDAEIERQNREGIKRFLEGEKEIEPRKRQTVPTLKQKTR